MSKHRVAASVIGLIATVLLSGCAGEVGQTETESINVPMPADRTQVWDVELNPGSASAIVGSSGESLVQGTIEYNVSALKPVVEIGERRVQIRQDVGGILPVNTRNDWRLQLGRGLTINLTVNTGASSGEWELGGLSLRRLSWTQGAADATVTFNRPNPERLDSLTVSGGAATLTMRGLANANIRVANVTAGVGALTLVFDGQLSGDADVILDGGVSAIAIYSGGSPIQFLSEGSLKAIENSGWVKFSDTYYSPEWSGAAGPRIVIRSRLDVASVRLIAGK